MKQSYSKSINFLHSLGIAFTILLLHACNSTDLVEKTIRYTISTPDPGSASYEVELVMENWPEDTVILKLPCWTPGYYQRMNYAESIQNIRAQTENGDSISIKRLEKNSWRMIHSGNKLIRIQYSLKTQWKFVAASYIDSTHAYILPAATFLYPEGHLLEASELKIESFEQWNDIVTGLEIINEAKKLYCAPNFDVLYDCPILLGNLIEFPSFEIEGIKHRFIAYDPGDFNTAPFIEKLESAIREAIDIFQEIPYKAYTFIGIGPGMGGIEHLNNTTVSFSGAKLNTAENITGMLSFLTHEYFHHYNVKRIRPIELGPFDYEKENRTNQLWICEGITVYYESRILYRAGLIDNHAMLNNYSNAISHLENDEGRLHQSLAQASYQTWEDGPFGNPGSGEDQSISVYNKGEVLALLLDLKIRFGSNNKKSLDDVMYTLYHRYYKEKNRGFSEAEFQQVCEEAAGISLSSFFEYVYTTKEINYTEYLTPFGLKLTRDNSLNKLHISMLEHPNSEQQKLLDNWLLP